MRKAKSIQFFIGMSIIGALLIVLYACLTGNGNQTFTDVVIEYTSRSDANKTAERNLFYIFPILGSIVYAFTYLKNKWIPSLSKNEVNSNYIILATLITTIVAKYAIYQQFYIIVLAAFAVTVAAYLINKELVLPIVSLFFMTVYAFVAIYRICVYAGAKFNISALLLSIAAAVLCIVFIILSKKKDGIYRAELIAQLFIPFELLIYVASSYMTSNGQIVKIATTKRIQAVIYLLILAFVAEAIFKIKKSWNNPDGLQSVLTYGTCVAIMAFNRYSGTGSIADFDLHHNFENVIGFSQMFELGQKAFSEYIPVSGMYSLGQGFVFWFFGHGLASYYFVTANLYYLFIIMLIVFLMRKQFKPEWVLLFSLLFLVKDYNRVALILPIALLLTWPKLIDNKNLWLKAWFLSSFVHGLYYPVFGAAVCLGFLPLGIWQIVSYAKSGQLKQDVKTVKFWVWWAVCALPVIAGLKLLIGTAMHMLAMGSQTIYADGIARFGQVLPTDFFAYIPSLPIRVILYYLVSYWVVICLIWISVALCLKCWKNGNSVGSLISISIAIILLISFSFTVVRFDIGNIYSRTDGPVRACFVLLVLVLSRYISKNDLAYKWIYVFAVASVAIVSVQGKWAEGVYTEGLLNIDNNDKLSAYYTVPENDAYVDDTNIRLGKAFIDLDSYNYITAINSYADTLDADKSYLGLVDSFGLYYLCDIKGDSVMEIFNTIKGYGAAEETVNILRETGGIVGRNINPDSNYYLYHWLMTSGEYIWDESHRVFIPNDGSYRYDDVVNAHKYLELNYSNATPLAYTCSSWGQSMDTLEPIFSDPKIEVKANGETLSFNRSFDGNEADFLYIEFEDMDKNEFHYLHDGDGSSIDVSKYGILKHLFKKNYNQGMTVTVSWQDESGAEHSVYCLMDEGKLLIPVGSGAGWYFNQHDSLNIRVAVNGETVDTPVISTARMLKLREVK